MSKNCKVCIIIFPVLIMILLPLITGLGLVHVTSLVNILLLLTLNSIYSHSNKSSNIWPLINHKTVVNFSSVQPNRYEIHYLKLNNYFAHFSKPSFSNIIASIEKALKFNNLNPSQEDSIKHLIVNNVNFKITFLCQMSAR